MKLIAETVEQVEFIVEEKKGGAKTYKIKGPFMQSEVKNRNGRMYPKAILANEAKRYNEDYVKKNRAYGELGHPSGPTINLERASHMITNLEESGNDWIGTAKILSTPMGQIVRSLMDEGATLGVSSRGMGSLKEDSDGVQIVQDDYHIATAADIVADPSAPNAFVQGIMEGKEWVWDNGILSEHEVSRLQAKIDDASRKDRESIMIEAFESLLSKF